MLDALTQGFRDVRLKLKGKARLSEENIAEALQQVRISLLEGDVDLDVVKSFLGRVKERSLGEVVPLRVTKGEENQVTPGDHFVKICHDELIELMGGERFGRTRAQAVVDRLPGARLVAAGSHGGKPTRWTQPGRRRAAVP